MFRIINHTIAALLFLLLCSAAAAADVNLNGVIGTKALVVVDGGKPRLLAVGDNLPIVLLGMSFLNRMEMKRDSEKMVLTKRF